MDSTYAHLEKMLTFDWRSPPASVVSALRSTGAPTFRPGDLSRCHRQDLAAEGRRDPDRATRMLAATAAVEAAVDRRQAPTLGSLCAVQRLVLGAADEDQDQDQDLLRTGPAHCHRRRYGWWPGLPARLGAKLRADAVEPLHPLLRAVRLYLDLIHLHPFVDGNARAARLRLTWWLALGGLPLPRLDPLIRTPKLASADPWSFVHILARGVAQCPVPTGLSSSARSR